MSKVIELRLTKTDYEKVLVGALLADYMKNLNREIGERDAQFIKLLMAVGEINKLNDLVTWENGEIAATEKVIRKIEKVLENYIRVISDETEESVSKK